MEGQILKDYMIKCFPDTHLQDGYLYRTYLTKNDKRITDITYNKPPPAVKKICKHGCNFGKDYPACLDKRHVPCAYWEKCKEIFRR